MTTRVLVGLLALGLLSVSAAPRAGGAHPNAEAAVTVQGEVLDMACYGMHEAKGKEHARCAKACLLGGAPAGLLSADGRLYLLVDDHKNKKPLELLRKLGGEKAKVTGTLVERGGVSFLSVTKAEKI